MLVNANKLKFNKIVLHLKVMSRLRYFWHLLFRFMQCCNYYSSQVHFIKEGKFHLLSRSLVLNILFYIRIICNPLFVRFILNLRVNCKRHFLTKLKISRFSIQNRSPQILKVNFYAKNDKKISETLTTISSEVRNNIYRCVAMSARENIQKEFTFTKSFQTFVTPYIKQSEDAITNVTKEDR